MKHQFTAEETARGASASLVSRAKALKLEKFGIKSMNKRQELAVMGQIATNPAVIGTGLFILTSIVERGLISSANNSSSPQTTPRPQVAVADPVQKLLGDLPIIGGLFQGSVMSALTEAEFGALKIALLAYIATGGNIAGSLGTVTGLATKVASAL